MFVWLNGEEKGLLGSRYYVEHPVIPMTKTLVDINLDMIGRSKVEADTGKFLGFDLTITQPGEILMYSAHESKELTDIVNMVAEKTDLKIKDMGPDLEIGSSDHESFRENGVPAFLFNSGLHADLHTTRDDVDMIDFDKMEKVSKMVFLFGYTVANQKERIKIDN